MTDLTITLTEAEATALHNVASMTLRNGSWPEIASAKVKLARAITAANFASGHRRPLNGGEPS